MLSCTISGGEAKNGKECGAVTEIDRLVTPRLRRLATCAGLTGQSGKLSVVVKVDFTAARFSHDVGKSTSLRDTGAASACLDTVFEGASLDAVQHTHPRYTIAYTAIIDAPRGDLEAASDGPGRGAVGE
ncbi:MAG: hypothetical protein H3C60_15075, partial [Sphingomonadaceae bacterium]|nr:hypothetical protein [Sphingomonadaceae bacterium]